MEWTYFSPHLDDAAFSCGGLIWEQVKAGEIIHIWTIFAGDPPEGLLSDFAEELQSRWQGGRESISRRRQEDIIACERIGASYRHLTYQDCIYRGGIRPAYESERQQGIERDGKNEFYYPSHASLFGPIHPAEICLIEQLSQELADMLPEAVQLVCPLTLGDHVDHKLTRAAVEKLGCRVWYYADYPYVINHLEEIYILKKSGWKDQLFCVSDAGMEAWKQAVSAYRSQISSFWLDIESLEKELEEYREFFGGVMLWQPRY